ncbi:MAG: Mur ligase family protein [Acidobacteriota bacterium]
MNPCEAALAPRLEQRILPGLERITEALDALGHPERRYPAVVVVGTNGKGSTACLLASVLKAHGVRVGLYTSPHLVRVEERIRVDSRRVAERTLLDLLARLRRFPDLSYFETITAAALLVFAEEQIDLAVLEAGLGGRWDATNSVRAGIGLLTNIGTDHQSWLGSARAAIAAEKAAVLRGCAGVIGQWDDEVAPAIVAAADRATPLSLASEWASVTPGGETASPGEVRFRLPALAGQARLSLLGAHQLDNLRLALAGAAALAANRLGPRLEAGALRRGLEAVRWPGRLQWLDWQGRALLLDGAHNREATAALVAAIAVGVSGPLHLLFSCLDDKPLAEMARLLLPRVAGVTVAPLNSPRATPLSALAAAFPGCEVAGSVEAALGRLPAELPTLVTGSLRLVGEVLALTGEEHEC